MTHKKIVDIVYKAWMIKILIGYFIYVYHLVAPEAYLFLSEECLRVIVAWILGGVSILIIKEIRR